MARVLIGTSGYSYKDWVGPLYPEGTDPGDYLGFYSKLFPTVELNFSYYRMPNAGQLAELMKKAGPKLLFSIKANEALTHSIEVASWRSAAKTFMDALEPLRTDNRLAGVLLQFPYSFHYEVDRRRYLNDLLGALAGLPLAVEFRCSDWYNNRVIDAFRERRIALSSMDMPALKGLPPLMDVVTSPSPMSASTDAMKKAGGARILPRATITCILISSWKPGQTGLRVLPARRSSF
ncbi:hypothetical protein MASR2M78_29390 [Treponema sp.]